MGLFCNKIDKRKLKPGDHIYSYRNVHAYSHHGIYVGENMVIHFTRTKQKNDNVAREPTSTMDCCGVCGYERKMHRGVVKTCLDCFLKGHSLYLFEYNVSRERYVAKRSGTCSKRSCLPSDVIIRRATTMLESKLGFGNYSLFENNCESFAVYCTTGESASSSQALSVMSKAQILIHNLTGPQPFSFSETIAQLALTHKIDKSTDMPVQQNYSEYPRRTLEQPKEKENQVKDIPWFIWLVFVIVCFIMFFLGVSVSSCRR